MADLLQSSQPVLHIWPRQHTALSLDPSCVAALLYLQLCIPGKFSVAYCTNPDDSPSGQLPFLVHGLHSVTTLSSIFKYVSNINGARNLDERLTPAEKAQHAARIAHVESELGDLVAHMLYSLNSNWWKVTRPMFASILPVPQRYYVPGRLRDSYKVRLEAAGLWDVPGIEHEEEENPSPFKKRVKQNKAAREKAKFKSTFERSKVLEKARAFFGNYAKLLGEKKFFHSDGDDPTSLDVIFAAHVHLLLEIPFTDPLIQTLLLESYPSLVTHARNLQKLAFPDASTFPSIAEPAAVHLLGSLIPWPVFRSQKVPKSPKELQDERQFALMRWGWIGLAVVGFGTYISMLGLRISISR